MDRLGDCQIWEDEGTSEVNCENDNACARRGWPHIGDRYYFLVPEKLIQKWGMSNAQHISFSCALGGVSATVLDV